MPDDPRDRIVTPAAGHPVVAATVDPDTGVHEVIDPDPAAAAERMQRRIKETSSDVKDANTGISTLRIETKGHIDRIESKVDNVETKVDKLGTHVLNLTATIGPVAGQIPELVKSVDDLRGRQHVTFRAQVDVDTAEKVATIEDTASITKNRRELRYKIAITLLSFITAATIALEHC